jgi:hypothetical protein
LSFFEIEEFRNLNFIYSVVALRTAMKQTRIFDNGVTYNPTCQKLLHILIPYRCRWLGVSMPNAPWNLSAHRPIRYDGTTTSVE